MIILIVIKTYIIAIRHAEPTKKYQNIENPKHFYINMIPNKLGIQRK